MNKIPICKLIENLEKMRKKACCYGPDAKVCDCKYGASNEGEETGCPELRCAIEYLRELQTIDDKDKEEGI
jgi:hypothetical protein